MEVTIMWPFKKKNKIPKPAIVTFIHHQNEFSFLGNENIITDSSNFGTIWDNFFKMGGYDKILPYAIDTKPLNIWYSNDSGDKVYFQGLMVENVPEVPDGYSLLNYPESDFLVLTHGWTTPDISLTYGISNGWKNEKTIAIPDGYTRYDGKGSPITIIEKENTNTPDGSRYEFWIPIKKID